MWHFTYLSVVLVFIAAAPAADDREIDLGNTTLNVAVISKVLSDSSKLCAEIPQIHNVAEIRKLDLLIGQDDIDHTVDLSRKLSNWTSVSSAADALRSLSRRVARSEGRVRDAHKMIEDKIQSLHATGGFGNDIAAHKFAEKNLELDDAIHALVELGDVVARKLK